MNRSRWRALWGGVACLVLASPISAQVGVIIHGRVEDTVSREPVPGARVFSVDSSSVVYTDSLGPFYIPVPAEGPLAIQAERIGYLSERFDLEEDAPSRISILLLEPVPIVVEGITAVDEAALTVLLKNLENRRRAYPSAMNAFYRTQLERWAPLGTVLDFVLTRKPFIRGCYYDPFEMCVSGRGRTFRNLNPENRVLVCVDGWKSYSPFGELGNLPIQSVALVELYGSRSSQVRVYTLQWMLSHARAGRAMITPLYWGC